jgi:hypothetical protein
MRITIDATGETQYDIANISEQKNRAKSALAFIETGVFLPGGVNSPVRAFALSEVLMKQYLYG